MAFFKEQKKIYPSLKNIQNAISALLILTITLLIVEQQQICVCFICFFCGSKRLTVLFSKLIYKHLLEESLTKNLMTVKLRCLFQRYLTNNINWDLHCMFIFTGLELLFYKV